jgi:hypothetical protein
MEQIFGIIVEIRLQASVSHDHSVDDIEFLIHTSQVFCGIFMAHSLCHGVSPRFGWEKVQVGVDDFHAESLLARYWAVPQSRPVAIRAAARGLAEREEPYFPEGDMPHDLTFAVHSDSLSCFIVHMVPYPEGKVIR